MSRGKLLSTDPSAYTVDEVCEWLKLVGFGAHEKTFRSNGIDGMALIELEGDDLESLGMVRMGHRKQLMRKLAALKAQSSSAWDATVDRNSSSSQSGVSSSSQGSTTGKQEGSESFKLKIEFDGEVSLLKVKQKRRFKDVKKRIMKKIGVDAELHYMDDGDKITIDRDSYKTFVKEGLKGVRPLRLYATVKKGGLSGKPMVKVSPAVIDVYATMAEAVVLITSTGDIFEYNSHAEKLLGWSRSEVLGQNVKMLMSESDAKSHDFYLSRYMRNPEASRLVGKGSRLVMAVDRDRRDVPIHLSISAKESDDKQTYFVGVLRRASTANTDENSKYEILNGVLSPALVIDTVGEIIFINMAVSDQLGYLAIDLLGENISSIVPEPHKSNHDQYLKNYMNTGESKVIGQKRKLSVVHADGRELPCELSVTQMGRGNDRTFTGIIELIDEALPGQEYIDKTVKKLNKLQLPAACLDALGIMRAVNGPFLSAFGYDDAADLLGQNVKMLMPENIAIKHDAYLRNYLKDPSKESTVVGKGRTVSAMHKSGNLFPAYLSVKLQADAEGHQFFLATMQLQ